MLNGLSLRQSNVCRYRLGSGAFVVALDPSPKIFAEVRIHHIGLLVDQFLRVASGSESRICDVTEKAENQGTCLSRQLSGLSQHRRATNRQAVRGQCFAELDDLWRGPI